MTNLTFLMTRTPEEMAVINLIGFDGAGDAEKMFGKDVLQETVKRWQTIKDWEKDVNNEVFINKCYSQNLIFLDLDDRFATTPIKSALTNKHYANQNSAEMDNFMFLEKQYVFK